MAEAWREKLTEQTVPKVIRDGVARAKGKVLPSGRTADVFVWDAELDGFGIRCFANGVASFIVRTGLNRATLGDATTKGNLAKARKEAEGHLFEARNGRDVIGARRDAERKAKLAKTLGQAVPDYLSDREHGRWNRRGHTIKPRALVEIKRQLEKDWKPLHPKALEEITREDVAARVKKIADEQGPGAADRARAALATLYVWAFDNNATGSTPFVVRFVPRAGNGKRQRTLSEAELALMWRATDAVNDKGKRLVSEDYARIVKLLVLTGQRRDEIGGLSWAEVVENGDGTRIELPPERTKNSREHLVPLTDQAKALLPARRNSTPMVFGRFENGFSGWSKAKAELDAAIVAARKEAGIEDAMPHWTIHDLRRTFATLMREKGLADTHLVELIINHVSGTRGGVAGVYDRSERLAERRAALAKWGEWVAELVGGG